MKTTTYTLAVAAARPALVAATQAMDDALVLMIGAHPYSAATTEQLTDAIMGSLRPATPQAGRAYGEMWNTIRNTCGSSPYIQHKGTAGSHGAYWGLTAAGLDKLLVSFDYRLIREATS